MKLLDASVVFGALLWTPFVTSYQFFIASNNPPSILLGLDYAFDAIFMTNVVVACVRAYHTPRGVFVADPKSIFSRYVGNWRRVAVDVVSAVPTTQNTRLIHLARVLVAPNVFSESKFVRDAFERPRRLAFFSLVELFYGVVLVIHCFACFWAWLGVAQDESWLSLYVESQDTPASIDPVERDTDRYLLSLYFAANMLISVGPDVVSPYNRTEYAFCAVYIVVGAAIWAFAIGLVVNVVDAAMKPTTRKTGVKNEIELVLRRANGPSSTTDDVREFVDSYLRSTAFALKEHSADAYLSPTLRARLEVELHRHALSGIWFIGSDEALLRRLVRIDPLERAVCAKGDRHRVPDDCMAVLVEGIAGWTNGRGDFRVLTKNSVVGMGYGSNGFVNCLTFVELLVVRIDSVERALGAKAFRALRAKNRFRAWAASIRPGRTQEDA